MALSESVKHFERALEALGVSVEIRQLDRSTHTAQAAAEALSTTVAQIVKSLVFVAGDEPLLVETSGVNRVDMNKLAALTGTSVRRADAKEVRAFTGYAIGGVAPVSDTGAIRTLVDEDLLDFETLWAAAGAPDTVFRTTPQQLLHITGGEPADVKQGRT